MSDNKKYFKRIKVDGETYDVQDEAALHSLNIEDAEGEYSATIIEDKTPTTSYPKGRENEINGRASFGVGHKNKEYQCDGLISGGGNKMGLTKAEFNAWWWDENEGIPLHGGKGKDEEGRILDTYGSYYEKSYINSFMAGEGGELKFRDSISVGYNCKNENIATQTFGEGTIARREGQMSIGVYNKNDPNEDNLFEIGNGTDNEHRKNAFSVNRYGQVKVGAGIETPYLKMSYLPGSTSKEIIVDEKHYTFDERGNGGQLAINVQDRTKSAKENTIPIRNINGTFAVEKYLEVGATYQFNEVYYTHGSNAEYWYNKLHIGDGIAYDIGFTCLIDGQTKSYPFIYFSSIYTKSYGYEQWLNIDYGSSAAWRAGSVNNAGFKTITINQLTDTQYNRLSDEFLQWFEAHTTKIASPTHHFNSTEAVSKNYVDSLVKLEDVKINNQSIVNQNKIANLIYETGLGSDSNNTATVTAIRNFVNSSINSLAAFYITSDANRNAFATKADLVNGPWYYDGSLRTPTKNDYAIVIADESHEGKTSRYSFGNIGWSFQYTFNMQFTQPQIDALNSGIDSIKVDQIAINTTAILDLQNNKVDKVDGKDLSTEDYTTGEKIKLDGIKAGAEPNEIDTIIAGDNIAVQKSGKTVTISSTSSSAQNIVDGEGLYSATVKEDTDRQNEMHGRAGLGAGHKNKYYQLDGIIGGNGNKMGLTEVEFNEYYWSSFLDEAHLIPDPNGSSLHNGQGLNADNKIKDPYGSIYEKSYINSFMAGEGGKLLFRDSVNVGYQCQGLAPIVSLFGKGLRASKEAMFTCGQFNKDDPNDANEDNIFEVGIGTDKDHRENGFAVSRQGDTKTKGNAYIGGSFITGVGQAQFGNYIFNFPAKNGTVATTDDIPTIEERTAEAKANTIPLRQANGSFKVGRYLIKGATYKFTSFAPIDWDVSTPKTYYLQFQPIGGKPACKELKFISLNGSGSSKTLGTMYYYANGNYDIPAYNNGSWGSSDYKEFTISNDPDYVINYNSLDLNFLKWFEASTEIVSLPDDLYDPYDAVPRKYINDLLINKVDKEVGKGLSSNDFTDDWLEKLTDIAPNAQVNVIDSIALGINDTTATIDNKKALIPYAGNATGGLIKTSSTYATTTYNGALEALTKNYSEYEGMSTNAFISKGTLKNVIENRMGDTKILIIDESDYPENPDSNTLYFIREE